MEMLKRTLAVAVKTAIAGGALLGIEHYVNGDKSIVSRLQHTHNIIKALKEWHDVEAVKANKKEKYVIPKEDYTIE